MNSETQKVEIKSIVVRIGEKDFTLTLQEAQELQAELNKHLGGPTAIPVWITPQVVYVDRVIQPPVYPSWPQPYITYGDTTGCYRMIS
jgi:hypothetical protein